MTELVSAEHARTLTDRIKVAVEGTWQLIKEAYEARAWDALGYASWDDYCTREFGTSRLRLPREDRQEVVASLRESGMSVRAIASATGVARNTVRNELRSGQVGQIDPPEEPGDEPAPITGVDGKTYSSKSTQAASRPRTDVVAIVNVALGNAEKAARAADQISGLHLTGRGDEVATWRDNLVRSLESLERLRDLLEGKA